MAHVVLLMGKGGQRRAERELGWTRDIIRKGMKELKSGIVCIDKRKIPEVNMIFEYVHNMGLVLSSSRRPVNFDGSISTC